MCFCINQTKFARLFVVITVLISLAGCVAVSEVHNSQQSKIRVATFNVSMEATNYESARKIQSANNLALINALATGKHTQIKNIAEIIQRTRPDIILLNEFDYIPDAKAGIDVFKSKYLEVSQLGFAPIFFPYVYIAPVNTGVKTPFQDKNSRLTHYGFGKYPGQYGMVLLSKYPIEFDQVRTFQSFLWQDMPNHLMPKDEAGNAWYNEKESALMRLSSKSHWDLPINVCNQPLHILASHPTPPVFDGKEDRNGKRNHDEIRFWKDYIKGQKASYHYDDSGQTGGIVADRPFVILGDLNASPDEGDAHPNAIKQLLVHPRINNQVVPKSMGGAENKPESMYGKTHTASWGIRADYVLPSSELVVEGSGVFWPAANDEASRLVSSRTASSDHRLVWADITLPVGSGTCQ